ncbi:hypothetical protein [Desulfoprunum benzoelyticum]|uniref:hypothetical protein n=1 Tax=Desulfoprunum benzoelyticum TaxID=1506996 RepID=UPI001F062CD3|nr:hypothetical protein [Desulfoprunum benzoelyticum]
MSMPQLLLQRLDALVRLFDFQGQRSALGPDPPGLHRANVRADVDAGQAVLDPLIGKAPVVDPRSHAVQLQGVVTHGRPG